MMILKVFLNLVFSRYFTLKHIARRQFVNHIWRSLFNKTSTKVDTPNLCRVFPVSEICQFLRCFGKRLWREYTKLERYFIINFPCVSSLGSIRSVMQKYLEDRGEVTFDKIFSQKIGKYQNLCMAICSARYVI